MFLLHVLAVGLLCQILVVDLFRSFESHEIVFSGVLLHLHLHVPVWRIEIWLKVSLWSALTEVGHRRANILCLLLLRHIRACRHV